MQIEEYLKTYQPIVYQTFVNSLKNNRLSHAYLISGEVSTPLLDVAKYLAKSILCDDPSPLACDTCITCLRVDSNNYPDFILFDGSQSTITDKNIEVVQERFKTEALERKGIMIYVLHLVENITTKAINSILKMLEEPTNQVYAFLTTNNKNKILPTIVSRCQLIQLNSIPRKIIIDKAIEYGVGNDDAELLSYFYNDAEVIFDFVNNEEQYRSFIQVKEIFNQTLEIIANSSKDDVLFHFQVQIGSRFRNKQSLALFIDMLINAFEEIAVSRDESEIILKNYAKILLNIRSRLNSVENILLDLMKQKSVCNLNVNIPLIIDHIGITIVKEIKDDLR